MSIGKVDKLNAILNYMGSKTFRIIGNKVIIKYAVIDSTLKPLFKDLGFNFYIDNLTATFIPECIKSCNNLDFHPTKVTASYFPEVRDTLNIKKGDSSLSIVDLGNFSCGRVTVDCCSLSGNLKVNSFKLFNTSCVNSLKIEGFGELSEVTIKANKIIGDLSLTNLAVVKINFNSKDSDSLIEINNIGILDFTELVKVLKNSIFKVSNVDTVYASLSFLSPEFIECNNLVMYKNLKFPDYSYYKGVYLCNTLNLSKVLYTKLNKDECPIPFVKFK